MNPIELICSGIFSLIGVIVGAWITQRNNEKNFEKKKQGAELLIKTELQVNIENLNEYYEKYLGHNFEDLKECGSLQNLDDFYYNLKYYPILTQKNWEKLTQFAPEIFDKEELDLIMKFFISATKLNQQVEQLYTKEFEKFKKEIEKSTKESGSPFCLEDFLFMECDLEEYDEIVANWRGFELKFKEILNYGKNILKIVE